MATAWPRLSLRRRLFLLAGVALAPALAILIYNEVALRRARGAEVHALALRFGQLAALETQGILEGTRGLLLAVARAPAVRAFDAERCRAYLHDVQAESPHLIAITAIDLQGNVRCRTEGTGQGQRLDDRSYFRDAVATDRFVVGEYTVSRISGGAALPLALAIRDGGGTTVGVVAAGLDLG